MMDDAEVLPNGHIENEITHSGTPAPDIAVEPSGEDADAMDTTPDSTQVEALPNGTLETPASTPTPAPNESGQDVPAAQNRESSPPVANENLVRLDSNGSPVNTTSDPPQPPPVGEPPAEAPAPAVPASPAAEQPPAPTEPPRSDSGSSDDDDSGHPWNPIQEDTSAPDEPELKEIEEAGETSALDHEHWEQKTFLPLDETEYVAGASGRIEWTVNNYNGTKEKPNKELVMKSQIVNIGGYDWQIKFYPKGNDSDYLSIYVECLSVTTKEEKKDAAPADENAPKPDDAMANAEDAMRTENAPENIVQKVRENTPQTAPEIATESQHAPLPLLGNKQMPKRRSVAAQVSVVLYNPGEPRVNYVRTCLHRFCSGSPDWGWTRYHGPYYEIQHRHRGQRQALLRNDSLAFTGYIRIVDDETSCLWEHHSRDNPWDSFAMTGLQSLTLGEGQSSPGGNIISAIASWMLFKPFRQFLYEFKVPDFLNEPFTRPKPLIAALQKVLYMLRTQVKTGANSVGLEDVIDALEWYGIQENFDKMDVIEVWETLRYKIEDELQGTPSASIFDELFGAKKNYMTGTPSYRASVKGVSSMQEAVNKTTDLLHPTQSLPQLLTVELDRQEFDTTTRTWIKLINKVTLDDNIKVKNIDYTLFGFVVHKENLQSYLYHPVLRPEGPSGKWYSYTDSKDENKVVCLTKRQAVEAHEGKAGSDKVAGRDPVAYIAMYVRSDVAGLAFSHQPETETWEVPEWLLDEMRKSQAARTPPSPFQVEPPAPPKTDAEKEAEEKERIANARSHEFQVIDSRAFLQHEGPGTIDAYDPKWAPGNSGLVYSVKLTSCDGCKEVRNKLAKVVKDIRDPRQIKFWFLDALRGTAFRPNLLSTGKIEYSSGSIDNYEDQSDSWSLSEIEEHWPYYRIWVHVIDFADLPELPKEVPKEPEPDPVPAPAPQNLEAASPLASQTVPPPVIENVPVPEPPAPENVPASEDTPMSEPDEPELRPIVQEPTPDQPDQVMVEAEVVAEVPPVNPPAVEVVIPVPPPPTDTEMSGTADLPPPPPAAEIQAVPPPPPPAATPVIPDEIYFFLKFFDAEAQTLTSRGSHIAPKSARVDTTVCALLSLPPDTALELHEEEDLTTTHPIRLRRSFSQNDLHNTTVIIATRPLTEEQRSALAARAAFADPQPYLAFRAHARNFPALTSGHFTSNYFSAQYYKGEMQHGHKHGHGTRIYHTGATYAGQFRLSLRHGHGLYTYQNGDTYDGEWVAGQQHGTGTFVEASTGNTYVGGWKQDKRFGEGVTHWKVAQETERLCRICWEEGAEAAFYDCGHVVACLGCARRVDVCPVCRKRVLSAMKLFYVS